MDVYIYTHTHIYSTVNTDRTLMLYRITGMTGVIKDRYFAQEK